MSMVVNELATNSLKYASGVEDSVSIDVEITVEDQTICLLYHDDGPGYPAATLDGERESLGLYLVHNIVRRELGGQVEISTDSGAVTRIRFPSDVLQAAAQGA